MCMKSFVLHTRQAGERIELRKHFSGKYNTNKTMCPDKLCVGKRRYVGWAVCKAIGLIKYIKCYNVESTIK